MEGGGNCPPPCPTPLEVAHPKNNIPVKKIFAVKKGKPKEV